MDLHTMAQVKRLFAWADADDETRNMELHLEVAFRIVAEQVWQIERRSTMTREQLRERDDPKPVEVIMEPAYREQKARLGQLIAGALHCRFVWFGSLHRVGPTTAYFVGSAVHVDRARLLYELIEPDLRLLTRFIQPKAGKGTGPGGAPSADGMDFFRARSWAMQDLVTWIGARLTDIEAGVAARTGLADDFRIDARNIDGFVDHLWRDAFDRGIEPGAPDLPLIDGIPYTPDNGEDEEDEDEDEFEDGEFADGEGDEPMFELDDDADDDDDDDDADDGDEDDDVDWDVDDEWEDDEESGFVHPDQAALDLDLFGGVSAPADSGASGGADSSDDHGSSDGPRPPGPRSIDGRSAEELLDEWLSMTDEEWARYNGVKDQWEEDEAFREDDSA